MGFGSFFGKIGGFLGKIGSRIGSVIGKVMPIAKKIMPVLSKVVRTAAPILAGAGADTLMGKIGGFLQGATDKYDQFTEKLPDGKLKDGLREFSNPGDAESLPQVKKRVRRAVKRAGEIISEDGAKVIQDGTVDLVGTGKRIYEGAIKPSFPEIAQFT